MNKGLDLYVGFADNPARLEQAKPMPIELIAAPVDMALDFDGFEKEIIEQDGKKYIIRTNVIENIKIAQAMAETFEYLEEEKSSAVADEISLADIKEIKSAFFQKYLGQETS